MTKYLHMDPFLSAADAANMLNIAEDFGSFGAYTEETPDQSVGELFSQRFDVGLNYQSDGTSYFRETYACGDQIAAPGIQTFMEHSALKSTARQLTNCERIVPSIVYANFLIPGQELTIHTDVPEFRGANRKSLPRWLLICMLHSGLFERWRIPILTCVSWFGQARGGSFAFYLEGSGSPRQAIPASHNSAILIDTDMVFHGVERVSPRDEELPVITSDTRLHFCEAQRWELREGSALVKEYLWSQLRYSISWKAYCFNNESEQRAFNDGSDDLNTEKVLTMLEMQLRERGVLQGARPEPAEFSQMLVGTFIEGFAPA